MNVTRPSVLWLATLAAVVVVVVLLHGILLPFVAGIALAYLLNPVVNGLARMGLNRTVAALGIISVFIIGVGVLVVLAIPIIGEEVATFIEKVHPTAASLCN
jgi:predicted PurR-regulated permease PerM